MGDSSEEGGIEDIKCIKFFICRESLDATVLLSKCGWLLCHKKVGDDIHKATYDWRSKINANFKTLFCKSKAFFFSF